MAQSFVRIGSFQIHASRREEDLEIVRTLADYVIRHHFQQFKNLPTELQTGSEDIKLLPEKNKYLGIMILSTFASIRQCYTFFYSTSTCSTHWNFLLSVKQSLHLAFRCQCLHICKETCNCEFITFQAKGISICPLLLCLDGLLLDAFSQNPKCRKYNLNHK